MTRPIDTEIQRKTMRRRIAASVLVVAGTVGTIAGISAAATAPDATKSTKTTTTTAKPSPTTTSPGPDVPGVRW